MARLDIRLRITIFTLGLGGLVLGGIAADAADREQAAPNGRIAWKGFLDPGLTTSAIFAGNPDGSARVQLTHPGRGVQDDLPDWSPDGSTIIFERVFQPSTNATTVPDQTMRVNADGSGLMQVGECSGDCLANDDPSYSPDGSRIVLSRAMLPLQPSGLPMLGIWIMGADGSAPRQITQLRRPTTSEDHEPAWSPDGTRIVFTRLNDTAKPRHRQALFVVPADGGGLRRITPWKLDAGGANWSPDGTRIVFQSYRDCDCSGTSQVYAVRPDGTHLTRITRAGRNIEPSWSPDGRQIVFGHQPGVGPHQSADIWRMPAESARGSANHTPVVQTSRWESEPDWGTAGTPA